MSFFLRRLLTSGLVFVGVVTLVFGVLRLVPGDPVESLLGEEASEAEYEALRSCFGLNDSLSAQYVATWQRIGDGSLGELCANPGVTVSDTLWAAAPSTLELALGAMLIALAIALPLGILSARKPYGLLDSSALFFSLAGVSIPSFWLGPMLLIVFTLWVEWLPSYGAGGGFGALVLPAFTLGLGLSAKLTRLIRSSMLDTARRDFVRTARAKGASEVRVWVAHVLRPALIPVVTVVTLQLGAVLSGAIVVEKVFGRAGIGTVLMDAISTRNYPLVEGTVLVIASVYLLTNLLADILYVWIDPRIALE